MALVSVQMAVSNGMILEATIAQATNDEESLLCRFFCLELELLDTTLIVKLGSDFAHLEAEVGGWHLG